MSKAQADIYDLRWMVRSLGQDKEPLPADKVDEYKAYFINRTFSYHADTVLIINELNKNPHLNNRLQYDFLLNTIPPKKRFSKRSVDKAYQDEVTAIQAYYKVNYDRARDIRMVLNAEQRKEVINIVNDAERQ